MEGVVNAVPCRELETVGVFINLPLDGKGTNVAGTQLPAWLAEAQSRVESQTLSPGW